MPDQNFGGVGVVPGAVGFHGYRLAARLLDLIGNLVHAVHRRVGRILRPHQRVLWHTGTDQCDAVGLPPVKQVAWNAAVRTLAKIGREKIFHCHGGKALGIPDQHQLVPHHRRGIFAGLQLAEHLRGLGTVGVPHQNLLGRSPRLRAGLQIVGGKIRVSPNRFQQSLIQVGGAGGHAVRGILRADQPVPRKRNRFDRPGGRRLLRLILPTGGKYHDRTETERQYRTDFHWFHEGSSFHRRPPPGTDRGICSCRSIGGGFGFIR